MNRQKRRHPKRQDKIELKNLKKKAKNPPRDPEACTKLGDQLMAAREWIDAIECYRIVLEQDETSVPVLAKLAYVCASTGLTDEAVQAYQAALVIEPENGELLTNLGAVLNAKNQPNRAIHYLERAIATKSNDPDCHYMLGESYRLLKQNDKSATQYALAIPLFRNKEMNSSNLIKVGRSLAYLQRFETALNFLTEAVQLAPNMPGAHFELAAVHAAIEDVPSAIACYQRTLELAPRHTKALRAYAKLMANQGQLAATAWAYRRLSLFFPDDASIRHMLAASSQKNVSGVTDEIYVKDIFDHYAEGFDEHLVAGLSYDTPQHLVDMFSKYWNGSKLNIMDLGCGTGLCGPLFRPMASRLIGVDLSQGMLAQAEQKAVYDELRLAELVSALEQEYQTQDLLIAADVLIYVGDIEPVFQAGQQALRTGGELLFSVETMQGNSYKLAISGRYQHSDAYIKALVEKYGFALKQQLSSVLRTESRKPISGELYLFEKISVD